MDEFFIKEKDDYLNNIADSDSSSGSSSNNIHKIIKSRIKK